MALLSVGRSKSAGARPIPSPLLLLWLQSQKCLALSCLCFLLTRQGPGKQCQNQLCLQLLAHTAAKKPMCSVFPNLYLSSRSRDWQPRPPFSACLLSPDLLPRVPTLSLPPAIGWAWPAFSPLCILRAALPLAPLPLSPMMTWFWIQSVSC